MRRIPRPFLQQRVTLALPPSCAILEAAKGYGYKTWLLKEETVSDFSVTEWIGEGISGVRSMILGSGRILPPAFYEHMRTSRKEVLLAFRSIFDAAIEGEEPARKTLLKKETSIKVE